MQNPLYIRRHRNEILDEDFRTGRTSMTCDAYQAIDKTVTKSGNSGSIYVPKDWIGRRVKILLLEDY